MSWWKLTIEFEEPYCCARKPLEGNETPSVPGVPATTLRGAIAKAMVLGGHRDLIGVWFGASGPRWMPAWPQKDTGVTIPTPLCYARDKAEEKKGIRNLFLELNPDAEPQQWEPLTEPYFVLSGPPLFGPKQPLDRLPETQMHVAIEYIRQSARSEALYSRSEIQPESKFVAWVEDRTGHIVSKEVLNRRIYLGKRSSAGSGRAALQAVESEIPWGAAAEKKFKPEGATQQIRFQLMTDTILPSPCGGYLRGLTAETLRHVLGGQVEVDVVRAFCDTQAVFGWSTHWGLPREQALALRAGSVCEFSVPAQQCPAIMERLRNGIGIRRNEGFGVVSVNPNWLYKDLRTDSEEEEPPDFKNQVESWPGLKITDTTHEAWCELALNAAEFAEKNPRLIDFVDKLASYAVRVPNLKPKDPATKIFDYLDSMARRENDRGWKDASKHINDWLKGSALKDENSRTVERVQFLLAATASFARKKES